MRKLKGINLRREAARQIFHALFGTFFIAVLVLWGRTALVFSTGACFVAGAVLSVALLHGARIPFAPLALQRVQRDHEMHLPGRGALALCFGIFLLGVLFADTGAIIAGLVVGTYGDAASTVLGLRFGRHKIPGTRSLTLEGTLGGVMVSALLLALVFAPQKAFLAALFGMLAEWLPVDDSFSMPLAAAFAALLL